MKFRKQMSEQESAFSRHFVHKFLKKTDNFEFFGPHLLKNGFRDRDSEN